MEKQAHQSCVTCRGPERGRIQTQTCLTGKSGFLSHMPLRLLPAHPSNWPRAWAAGQAPPPFPLSPRRWPPLGLQRLGSMPSVASLPCGPAPGSWPQGQAGVAMAVPYPWTALWAPQATGMSQKSHHSGQHPNQLSQTATLIMTNRKIFSDRVLVFSLENRWPPLRGPHTAFISLFPSILSSLCLSAQEHVVVTDTDRA